MSTDRASAAQEHRSDRRATPAWRGGRPGVVARVLLAAVALYRAAVSPRSLPSCRYLPTCSEYAETAVREHGAARGGLLAVRRLLRCHPWHAGGFDPVPPARADVAVPAPLPATAPSAPAD